jgi:glycosyltransferase involved in cell wall biosynthesis
MAWLPGPVRQPLAWGFRTGRAVVRRLLRKRRRPAGPGRTPLAGLDGATLVIAESLDAALAAIAAGVPKHRVWALALPAERLHVGDRSGLAGAVARAARAIGGFLTDSEPARDSLERAASDSRPRVEIYPPIAADRPCPEHAATVAGTELGDVPTGAGQLALWRRILDEPGDAGDRELPYSFPAARLRGPFARWRPSPQTGWHASAADAGAAGPAEPDPIDWSSRAQLAAARRVWEAVIPASPRHRRPRRALVAGFDLKFASDLAERLAHRPDLDVEVDAWRSLSQGTEHTDARLRRTESIFAEWARTSAIWYSRHKRPDQFLAVRLHRFELDAAYPREIAIDSVDAVVYIAPLFGRRIRDELGWPVRKLVYIPNFLDVDWLDRPKLAEARFAIGFVGIEWSRKRFDLALDLLTAVRREDPRFRLVVRSTMPWQNRYAWADPAERDYVGRCFERIEQDPALRSAVIFDEPGRDMGRWFRRIGHVLSTSDEEGCHTAVAEGMASAAVPVVRPWPGAAEIYDKEWVHASIEDSVAAVLASADPGVWEERGARARAEIRRTHDPVAVVEAWADLLHGDVASAGAHFAAYSPLPETPAPATAIPAPGPRRPDPVSEHHHRR